MWDRLSRAVLTDGRIHQGRLGRTVIYAWLAALATAVAAAIVEALVGTSITNWMSLGFGGVLLAFPFAFIILYLVWVVIAACVRRLHDRDKSGWWVIPLVCVPITLDWLSNPKWLGVSTTLLMAVVALGLALWGIAELLVRRGSPGDNRFGPSPLPKRQPLVPPVPPASVAP